MQKSAIALTYMPVSPLEIGSTLATGALADYAMGNLPRLWNKAAPKMSVPKAFATSISPLWLPAMGTFEAINLLGSAALNPNRESGPIGYLKDVKNQLSTRADEVEEAGVRARKRYGLAGIPVQLLHGLLNPMSSLAYLAKSVGGAVSD